MEYLILIVSFSTQLRYSLKFIQSHIPDMLLRINFGQIPVVVPKIY